MLLSAAFNILFEHAMETVTAENKEIFLLGDFNVDLLKIDDYNKIDDNFSYAVSGNLTVSISDYLPQIIIVPKENIKVTKKQILFKRDKNYMIR